MRRNRHARRCEKRARQERIDKKGEQISVGCEEEMAVMQAKRAEMKEGEETEAARAKCARKLEDRPPGLQQPEGQKEKEGKSGQNGIEEQEEKEKGKGRRSGRSTRRISQ